MLLISCSEKKSKKEEIVDYAYKMPHKSYMENNGKLSVGVADNETYLDYYFGDGIPEGKEATYDDLSPKERKEFDAYFERIKSLIEGDSTFVALKIYQKTDGRKTIARIVDFTKLKIKRKPAVKLTDGSYSVTQVNKIPIFPVCKPQQSSCFFTKLDNHFNANFNLDVTKKLGLPLGKNKVNTSFNINKLGMVSDVEVKTTYKEIEKEVTRVLKLLPRMTVGKLDGKTVKVKYTLPFTFIIK